MQPKKNNDNKVKIRIRKDYQQHSKRTRGKDNNVTSELQDQKLAKLAKNNSMRIGITSTRIIM